MGDARSKVGIVGIVGVLGLCIVNRILGGYVVSNDGSGVGMCLSGAVCVEGRLVDGGMSESEGEGSLVGESVGLKFRGRGKMWNEEDTLDRSLFCARVMYVVFLLWGGGL